MSVTCVRETLFADARDVAAYLFGSNARGTASTSSDIDIAVLFREPADARLGGPLDQLRADVERACARPCDIVDARAASPDLFHRVLRDGILLFDRDPSARVEFEVARRNEYFDLLSLSLGVPAGGTMTDEALIAKRLAYIETCLRELRELARPERIGVDIREERFVERTPPTRDPSSAGRGIRRARGRRERRVRSWLRDPAGLARRRYWRARIA